MIFQPNQLLSIILKNITTQLPESNEEKVYSYLKQIGETFGINFEVEVKKNVWFKMKISFVSKYKLIMTHKVDVREQKNLDL